MITFVGYYTPFDTASMVDGFRTTGGPPPEFQQKIREFPANLPDTCNLIGSWAVSGGTAPSVMVVEADSFDDLQAINQYYVGWLAFDWHPVSTGGVPRS